MVVYKWKPEDISNLQGKVALVTGATGGVGYETALILAKAGARVLVGGRSEAKGKEAIDKIKTLCPEAQVTFASIDHANLKSVEKYATTYNNLGDPIDILVNNAGVCHPPPPNKAADGLEIHWVTNYISHFALTLHLLPSLRRSSAPRIVNISSGMAHTGKINFDDLNHEKSVKSIWDPYSQTKLANLLFTLGLKKRCEEAGWNLLAVSAHPGFSVTGMTNNAPNDFLGLLSKYILKPFFTQSAADGALPQTFAATSEKVKSGGYYCPNGLKEIRGREIRDAIFPPLAKDEELADRLWKVSEEITAVKWVIKN